MKIKNVLSNRFFLMGLVFLVAILSILFFISKHHLGGPIEIYSGDQIVYDEQAMNLLGGKGIYNVFNLWVYTSVKVPVYSIFLAVLYLFFGHSLFPIQIIQFALSIFSCLIIYLIAEKIFNKVVAFGAAIIVSFYPIYLHYNLLLMRETLYIFLFVCFSYFVVSILENSSRKNFVFAGLLFGLSTLTRPTIILALPFFLVWLVVIFRKNRVLFLRIFICIGLLPTLLFGGWLLRGQMLAGAPIVEYFGNTTLWSFANGHFEEYMKHNFNIDPLILWSDPYASEGIRAQKMTLEALPNIIKNPVNFLKFAADGSFRMNCLTGGTCTKFQGTSLVILGLFGLFLGLIFIPTITIYFVICIFVTVVPSAVFGGGDTRYRIPLDWIYVMYAMYAIYMLVISFLSKEKMVDMIRDGKKFVELKKGDNKILCRVVAGFIVVVVLLFGFGLLKIGYRNIFCDNLHLNTISGQMAVDLLTAKNFSVDNKLKNWQSFEIVKSYIFNHKISLDDNKNALIGWAGIISTPSFFEAGQKMDNVVLFSADQSQSFDSTFFNFVASSETCSPGEAKFYSIFPGRLPEEFRDKKVVVVGQLKQNNSILDRFGIHIIAIIPIDKQGQPMLKDVLYAENLNQIQKTNKFYAYR